MATPNTIVKDSLLKRLPRVVHDDLLALPEDKQRVFVERYGKKKKRLWVAYLLYPLYGAYYVYLEKMELAFWFWLTAGAVLVWWVIDAFRMPGMVKGVNVTVALSALADARSDIPPPLV